jgi:hypothetical protein
MDQPTEKVAQTPSGSPIPGATMIAVPKVESTSRGERALRFFCYVYFLRFSILLWASLPSLWLADQTGASALTRGILALNNYPQVVLASFFVAMSGWIALLSARIVCAYGDERFEIAPPRIFQVGTTMSHRAFWLAQGPGIALLQYVIRISHHESLVTESGAQGYLLGYLPLIFSSVVGIVMALVCWILLAGIYYWLFWGTDPRGLQSRFTDPPKAFVVPFTTRFQALERREPSAYLLVLIELGKIPARLGAGFINSRRPFNPLHSGLTLAFLTLGFVVTVYGVFWDFTAPVPVPAVHAWVVGVIITVAVLWTIAAGLYHNKVLRPRTSTKTSLQNVSLMLLLFSPILVTVALPFTGLRNTEAMPVLASVCVLLLFVIWGLSGLAYFFDRFRIPVLLLLVIFSVLVHLVTNFHILALPADSAVLLAHPHEAETYPQLGNKCDSAKASCPDPDLKTPDQMFAQFEQQALQGQAGKRPVIIVTATGGGIHAAYWTSQVLSSLEAEFNTNIEAKNLKPGTEFHNSILLMSSVSGGSIAATAWAAEYLKPGKQFTGESLESVSNAVGCSSLQAVAWGLTYADFLRVLYPYRHLLFGQDLDVYDRGWALQQSFFRNRHYGPCGTDKNGEIMREETLGDLAWKQTGVPAFTFNTTIAETGDRFLGANYLVPKLNNPDPALNPRVEITPADSFLRVYHADLPLSSAARISANFPYVSPMPRVPLSDSHFHFGDGGYFDNDGTATALEFLYFANLQEHVPVLIIEIRDDGDIDASDPPDNLGHQAGHEDWGEGQQLLGPLVTFWHAGHTSISRRNRRELCFLEQAVGGKADIRHLVIDYDPGKANDPDANEPHALSWHLTSRESNLIKNYAQSAYIAAKRKQAVDWFRNALAGKLPPNTVKQDSQALEGCPRL